MVMIARILIASLLVVVVVVVGGGGGGGGGVALTHNVHAADAPPIATTRPTLFLVGDSTVKNSAKDQMGWGTQIEKYFDPSKITVKNHAIGGRSSRSFQAEGRWDKVLAELKPGDFLLIQFGHNDGAKPGDPKQDPRNRGSLRGVGEETVEIDNPAAGKKEIVHTFGWYMRKYARDAKARGATPIICSLVPRNDWKEGKVLRANQSYGKWAREVAETEGAAFIDLNEIAAKRYEELGQEKVKAFFPHEHTHTNAAGAEVNAQCVVEGIRALKDVALSGYLKP
jgi:rhamnogalacturonan acetylesterase